MDGLTLLFAILSGFANGTFPVFIKTKRVLAADVHPIVFQLYKSSWVCAFGLFCLALTTESKPPYGQPPRNYTWWAAASAAAWIPSGVSTIIAVPLIGVRKGDA